MTPPEGPAGSLTMPQSGKGLAAQAGVGLVLRGLRPPQPTWAPTSRPRTKPHPQRRDSKGPPFSHPQPPAHLKGAKTAPLLPSSLLFSVCPRAPWPGAGSGCLLWPAGPSVSLAWVGFLSRGAGAAGWVGSREASVLGVISASSRLQPGRQRWAGSVAGLGSWGARDASLPCP